MSYKLFFLGWSYTCSALSSCLELGSFFVVVACMLPWPACLRDPSDWRVSSSSVRRQDEPGPRPLSAVARCAYPVLCSGRYV